jgi:hypothetical protein
MKTVTIYHKSVPNSKSQEKIDLLKYFSLGVKSAGDVSADCYDFRYTPTDVAAVSYTHLRAHETLS